MVFEDCGDELRLDLAGHLELRVVFSGFGITT
jgi:hypothetical protein